MNSSAKPNFSLSRVLSLEILPREDCDSEVTNVGVRLNRVKHVVARTSLIIFTFFRVCVSDRFIFLLLFLFRVNLFGTNLEGLFLLFPSKHT